MRLAIIRQRYTPYGGAERFVENALEALLERNVAITLYTRAWPETRLKLIEPHIVDPFYLGRLWRDFGFARAVRSQIGRAHLDLVQSHERLLTCDVYRAGDGVHAVWLEERLRHAPWWNRLATRASPWHRYVLATERKLFKSPWLQAVICNSKMVRDEIRQRFRVPEEKLRVIYNAVDGQSFSPALREHRDATLQSLGIPADAIVYLLVGSGFERKGVATAVEALAQAAANAYLVVVGRDKHLERYRAFAADIGLRKRVVFTGPQADPRRFFGMADVFVLPTVYDPFPNAALEALACGLPVITSTKSGAAELVIERDCGLVCPSRDVASLAGHLRTLADAGLRARLGANARAAVQALTPEAMTLQLVLLYKELLEASARQQRDDLERKLKAHRDAYAGKAEHPAAEDSPAAVMPRSAEAPAAVEAHATADAQPGPQLPAAGVMPLAADASAPVEAAGVSSAASPSHPLAPPDPGPPSTLPAVRSTHPQRDG